MHKGYKPRLMITAIGSNQGKTIVTTALLKAFDLKGEKVMAYKSGPDYIDPMFHQVVTKVPATNLDLFLMGEEAVKRVLMQEGEACTISLLEGAMGYYDGIANGSDASAYALAKVTQTPVILVVKCNGMGASVAAVVSGFLKFKEDSGIQGVILNGIKPMMYDYYKTIVEEQAGVKVYGYMPYVEDVQLESRHLGLVTASEVVGIEGKVLRLGESAQSSIDLEGLLELASKAIVIDTQPLILQEVGKVRIGIAKDQAFCFYYNESLAVLEKLGATLVPFSPLEDAQLPMDLDGLYLGGGYPELYAEQLANNKSMKMAIKYSVNRGLPTFAECGGFMYLSQFIEIESKSYEMVGVVEGICQMTTTLKRFGYVTLQPQIETLFGSNQLAAHEFHYSDSTLNGDAYRAKKPQSQRGWECIISREHLLAGYPHIHFLGNIACAQRWIEKCLVYQEARNK